MRRLGRPGGGRSRFQFHPEPERLGAVRGRVAAAGVTACVDLAAFGAVEASAKRFVGRTSQRQVVIVRTAADGHVLRARINWRAGCRRPTYRYRSMTTFIRPFDESTPDRFYDAGSYRERPARGYLARVSVAFRGSRRFDPANPGAESWAGSFRVRAVVRRRGRVVDVCSRRGIRWRARLS